MAQQNHINHPLFERQYSCAAPTSWKDRGGMHAAVHMGAICIDSLGREPYGPVLRGQHTIGIEGSTAVGTDCTTRVASTVSVASSAAKAAISAPAESNSGASTRVAATKGARCTRHIDWSILL